jgi:hypothetical protein
MRALLRFDSDETWRERSLSLLPGSLRGNGVLVLLALVAVGVSPQVDGIWRLTSQLRTVEYSLNKVGGCVGGIIWKLVGSMYNPSENGPDDICPRVSKSEK